MKGISVMPVEAENKLIAALKMDETERQAFQHLTELTAIDESLLKARHTLDRFVFDLPQTEQSKPVNLVYYDREKYYRSLHEIWNVVLRNVKCPNFSCDIKIVNCVDPVILKQLSNFLEQLFASSISSDVEHLLTFVNKDYEQNLNAFISIITMLPLAVYKNYSAFYNHSNSSVAQSSLFQDTIIIKTAYLQDENNVLQYYWLSFLNGELSNCAAFQDDYLYSFLMDNYNHLKKAYTTPLCNSSGMEMHTKALLTIAQDTDAYLLKPNNCYDKIPMECWFSIKDRMYNEMGALLTGLRDESGDPAEAIQFYAEHFQERIKLTYRNKHTDVYCKDGLLEMVQTGKIADHMEGMPPFSPEELRSILEYIRDRNLDPNDSYEFYLTEKNIFDNGLVIVIYKGKGIIVEYTKENRQKTANNVFIESSELNQIFIDYIENHIPKFHALSKEDATEFINSLINKYTT